MTVTTCYIVLEVAAKQLQSNKKAVQR